MGRVRLQDYDLGIWEQVCPVKTGKTNVGAKIDHPVYGTRNHKRRQRVQVEGKHLFGHE